jgi:hypothetical protein
MKRLLNRKVMADALKTDIFRTSSIFVYNSKFEKYEDDFRDVTKLLRKTLVDKKFCFSRFETTKLFTKSRLERKTNHRNKPLRFILLKNCILYLGKTGMLDKEIASLLAQAVPNLFLFRHISHNVEDNARFKLITEKADKGFTNYYFKKKIRSPLKNEKKYAEYLSGVLYAAYRLHGKKETYKLIMACTKKSSVEDIVDYLNSLKKPKFNSLFIYPELFPKALQENRPFKHLPPKLVFNFFALLHKNFSLFKDPYYLKSQSKDYSTINKINILEGLNIHDLNLSDLFESPDKLNKKSFLKDVINCLEKDAYAFDLSIVTELWKEIEGGLEKYFYISANGKMKSKFNIKTLLKNIDQTVTANNRKDNLKNHIMQHNPEKNIKAHLIFFIRLLNIFKNSAHEVSEHIANSLDTIEDLVSLDKLISLLNEIKNRRQFTGHMLYSLFVDLRIKIQYLKYTQNIKFSRIEKLSGTALYELLSLPTEEFLEKYELQSR